MQITIELPVPLTDAEIVELTNQMLEARRDQFDVEWEAKRSAKSFKERIAALAETVNKFCDRLDDKTEDRPVECLVVDWEYAGEQVTIRLDTGAIVKREPLPRQRTLLEPPVKAKTKKTKETPAQTRRLMWLLEVQLKLADAGVSINFEQFFNRPDDDAKAAESWAREFLETQARGEDCPTPRPAWLDEILGKSEEEVALEHRCAALVKLLGQVNVLAALEMVKSWTNNGNRRLTGLRNSTRSAKAIRKCRWVKDRNSCQPQPTKARRINNDDVKLWLNQTH